MSFVRDVHREAVRTSFNIPDELIEEFDRTWRDEGIENRSRAVREAMSEFVESHSRLEDTSGEVVALVGFDYRHHEVIREVHGVQHEYQNVILNTSHTHQGEWCLESLFCRGDAERVRELTYRLRDFDAVRRVKLMLIRDGNRPRSSRTRLGAERVRPTDR
jgi:CopG family nickel-responsive transcriptional regulator